MTTTTVTGTRRESSDDMRLVRAALVVVPVLILTACATRSTPPPSVPSRGGILETREGLASYYGPGFNGQLTASGSRFDMNALVAAHPSYPFGTVLRVTNLANGRAVQVRVVDRGPAQGPRKEGVIIDLSRKAADRLDFIRAGRARVRIEVLSWGE
jgi:rare lipoprotein A